MTPNNNETGREIFSFAGLFFSLRKGPKAIGEILNMNINQQKFLVGLVVFQGLLLLIMVTKRDPEPAVCPSLDNSSPSRGLPSFLEIGREVNTDKVTSHRYDGMYEKYLSPMRNRHVKMLEIGLGCNMGYGPGHSAPLWKKYFRSVDLSIMEFDVECANKWSQKNPDVKMYLGDQADKDILEALVKKSGGDFDLIVDDGGHTMRQQIGSFEGLWKAIRPGGVYCIEDLMTSYVKEYGGAYQSPSTTISYFKNLMDAIHHPGIPPNQQDEKLEHLIPFANQIMFMDLSYEIVCVTKKYLEAEVAEE